jgi:hypothetical protein
LKHLFKINVKNNKDNIKNKPKLELIEEALIKNISGGTNWCGKDAGEGCWTDYCYYGSCQYPDISKQDKTPSPSN